MESNERPTVLWKRVMHRCLHRFQQLRVANSCVHVVCHVWVLFANASGAELGKPCAFTPMSYETRDKRAHYVRSSGHTATHVAEHHIAPVVQIYTTEYLAMCALSLTAAVEHNFVELRLLGFPDGPSRKTNEKLVCEHA